MNILKTRIDLKSATWFLEHRHIVVFVVVVSFGRKTVILSTPFFKLFKYHVINQSDDFKQQLEVMTRKQVSTACSFCGTTSVLVTICCYHRDAQNKDAMKSPGIPCQPLKISITIYGIIWRCIFKPITHFKRLCSTSVVFNDNKNTQKYKR